MRKRRQRRERRRAEIGQMILSSEFPVPMFLSLFAAEDIADWLPLYDEGRKTSAVVPERRQERIRCNTKH